MSSTDPCKWVEVYEAHIADMVAERELAQLDLSDSLKAADLSGATTASFRHAVASAELGDAREAQMHMFMAALFAEADVRLIADQVGDELQDRGMDAAPTLATFAVPACARQKLRTYVEADKNWRRYMYATELSQVELAEAEALRSGVAPAIEEAEAAVNVETLTAEEKNTALETAITATCRFIAVKSLRDHGRMELLRTACTMATHLEFNGDFESTQTAFNVYRHVALAAILTQGKTMPAITQALHALETIKSSAFGPIFDAEAQEYIDALTKARNFKIAFNSMLPIVRVWDAYRPYVEGSNEWWRITPSRAPRSLQRKARSTLAETPTSPCQELDTAEAA